MGTAAALRLQHARTAAPLRLQHAPATESRARTPLRHRPPPPPAAGPGRGPGPVCAAGVRRVHPSSRRHPSCAAMCPQCRRSTTSPRSFLAPALPRACTGLRGSTRALGRVRMHRTRFLATQGPPMTILAPRSERLVFALVRRYKFQSTYGGTICTTMEIGIFPSRRAFREISRRKP